MNHQNIASTSKAEDFGDMHAVLAEKIARWTKETEQLTSAIPALSFRRYEETTGPASYLHEPSICMVAQGAKHPAR